MPRRPRPPRPSQPSAQPTVGSGLERAAAAADRVSASIEKAARATSAASAGVKDATSAWDSFKNASTGALTSSLMLLGASAFAVVNFSRLLSDMTGIPLAIVATGMTAIAVATFYAVAPTWMWTSALWAANIAIGAVSAGFGVLMGAATTAAGTIWAALSPILVAIAPFALIATAIAAAVGAVYVVWQKWAAIPTWLKVLMPGLIALKIAIEAIAFAFRAVWTAAKLAVDVVLLPFKMMIGAAKLAYDAIMLVPRAIMAIPSAAKWAASAGWSALTWLGSAGWSAVQKITAGLVTLASTAASAAWSLTKTVTAGALSAAGWIAAAPGRLVGWMSGALGTLSGLLASAGGRASNLAARIVGPMTEAANAFADSGTALAKLRSDYDLTAEQASVFALAARMTGRSVKDLQQIMPAGSAAFAAFRAEAAASGQLMTGEEIASAKDLTIAYARLREAKAGLWNLVGSVVAPALKETTDLVLGAVRGATAWIREHKDMIATAWRIGSTAATVGTVLTLLATAVGTLGTVLGPLVTAAAAAAAGFALWDTAAGRASRNLAGGLWSRYGDSVRSAWDTVAAYGRRIWDFTAGVMQGVTDAVRGGRLDLAVTIAWTAAKLAWVKSLTELSAMTNGWIGSIFSALAAGNWSDAADAAWAALKIAFASGVDFLDTQWVRLLNLTDSVWATIANTLDTHWTALVNGLDSAGVAIVNAADKIWEGITNAWDQIETRGNTLLAFFSGLASGAEIVFNAMATAGQLAFAPLLIQLDLLLKGLQLSVRALLAVGGPLAKAALGGIAGQLDSAAASLKGAVAGPAKQSNVTAGAGAAATAAVTAATAAAAGPAAAPGLKSLAQLRAEQRERDLADRQAGRTVASGLRQGWRTYDAGANTATRDAELAERQAARQAEILDLEKQLAAIRERGDAAAAAKAAALQTQLDAAKADAAAAAEEAKLRGTGLGAVQKNLESANANAAATKAQTTAGTFSAAAARMMFGREGDSLARQQLEYTRRLVQLDEQAAQQREQAIRDFRDAVPVLG